MYRNVMSEIKRQSDQTKKFCLENLPGGMNKLYFWFYQVVVMALHLTTWFLSQSFLNSNKLMNRSAGVGPFLTIHA